MVISVLKYVKIRKKPHESLVMYGKSRTFANVK